MTALLVRPPSLLVLAPFPPICNVSLLKYRAFFGSAYLRMIF